MKKLLKSISIYSIGGILNKSIQFLLLPLYTRILQPADYGKLELVYMVSAILVITYGFMVEIGYSRIFFDSNDPHFRKKLFFSGQAFNLSCGLIVSAFMILFSNWIATWLFQFEEGGLFVKLVSIIAFLRVMTIIPLNNIRNREKPKQYVTVNVIFALFSILMTIYFLVVQQAGVTGVLYAMIISSAVELIILYWLTKKEMCFTFSFSLLYKMLSFSIFLILPALSSFILHMGNRYFLQHYQDLNEVGLFSLGYKIASIIPILVTEPVKAAFGPHVYSLVNDPEKCKKTISRFTRYFLGGLLAFAFLLAIMAREMIILMADDSYYNSYSIVFILVISYVFLGLSGIVVLGIQIEKKTWVIAIIFPLSALLNLILNFFLVPEIGRTGAAIATLSSFIFINIGYFIAVHYIYRIPFEYGKYILLLMITLLFYFVSTFVTTGVFISILLKTGIFLIFIFTILISGYFSKEEITKAKLFIISKFNALTGI